MNNASHITQRCIAWIINKNTVHCWHVQKQVQKQYTYINIWYVHFYTNNIQTTTVKQWDLQNQEK